MIELAYVPVTDWPPLAWLARCRTDSGTVQVFHGPRVETRPEWFCEGVWDGAFPAGGFDETDLLFGSGGRVRSGTVRFISSFGTLDRLHSATGAGEAWISNSLPCLASATSAAVDPTYSGYTFDFRSINRGIDEYVDVLRSSAGPIRITYHRLLRWTGSHLVRVERTTRPRAFPSFESYRGFLEDTLRAFIANAADRARTYRYEPVATVSSGYDSPAVAVLARPLGLDRTFGLRTDRHGEPDDGADIAARLGLDHAVLERGGWHERSDLVATFLVADANGSDLDLTAGGDLLEGSLFLSGNYGHSTWERHGHGPEEVRFARRDNSGLPLLEYRLHRNFIQVPVPMLGLDRIDDLQALAASQAMAPWSLGGRYDRPIPRRILEQAGIPRGSFAITKKGVSLLLSHPDLFWKPWSKPYLEWLDARRGAWLRRGRLPPRWLSAVAGPMRPTARTAASILESLGGPRARRWGLRRQLARFASKEYLYLFLFPWALERLKRRYRADEVVGGV